MESFKVDLNPIQKQSKFQPYWFIIAGIIYIILGFLQLNKSNDNLFFGLFQIIMGIVFLFLSYYHKYYSSKYFFEIDNNSIQIKQSIKAATKIKWSELKEIHIKPIGLELRMRNETKEEISLGNVGYKNVLDIKSKLLEFAKQKNIKVT